MTTAQYVTLVLDRYDGAGNPVTRGTASWAPSMELPDPADQMLVGQAPVTATFRAGSLPSVRLVSTDSIGPQPDGWTWTVTYDGVPGSPPPASYYILAANGATQSLSALATVPAAQPGQISVPLPPGAPPAPGLLWQASGAGYAGTWVTPAQALTIDAGPPGAAYAAVIDGGGPGDSYAGHIDGGRP